MTAEQLEEKLRNEIPLTKALGFEVLSLSTEKAQCRLPLAPNINHKQTLFGGSQYAGCALACYSLFLFNVRNLENMTNNIVVSKAEISYYKPALADVFIEAVWPSEDERQKFLKGLEKKGKARGGLLARVKDESGLLLSQFLGDFVVFT